MIPWIYHRLSPRDQGSDLLRIVNTRLSASGLLPTLSVSYDVPSERTLLISLLNGYAAAGAGQSNDRFTLAITNQAGTDTQSEIIRMPLRDDVIFAGTYGWFQIDGAPGLMVPPSSRITLYAFFNGGANANALTVGLNGLLIPHGTFSE